MFYSFCQSVEVIVPPKAKIGKTFVVEVPDPVRACARMNGMNVQIMIVVHCALLKSLARKVVNLSPQVQRKFK